MENIIPGPDVPTWIGEDDQGEANVVNHVSAQSKNHEKTTRIISRVKGLVNEKPI